MPGVIPSQPMANSFRRALMISSWSSFYTRPLTIILFLISIAAIAMPMISDARKKKAGTLSQDAEEDVD